MAIVVEEERQKGAHGVVTLVIWIALLAIIIGAVYYIFFRRPALVEVVAPPGFTSVETIVQSEVDPTDVLRNPAFQRLREYVRVTVPEPQGRANPFARF